MGDGLSDTVYGLSFDYNNNLYAVGVFWYAGNNPANYIAKWDGSAWSNLSSGMNNTVYAITIDTNNNIYTGGDFTFAGGISANYITKISSSINLSVNGSLVYPSLNYSQSTGVMVTNGGNAFSFN